MGAVLFDGGWDVIRFSADSRIKQAVPSELRFSGIIRSVMVPGGRFCFPFVLATMKRMSLARSNALALEMEFVCSLFALTFRH